MKSIILIGSILFIAYKVPFHTNQLRFQNYKSNVDTSKYAIFQLKDSPSDFEKGDMPANVSEKDIQQIENMLKQRVLKENAEFKKYSHKNFDYIGNPQKYYKQVIAVINSKGEKIVWVNCLCSVHNEPDWKTRIIGMLDGGSCYFNCKINLTKNKLYNLMVNGVG